MGLLAADTRVVVMLWVVLIIAAVWFVWAVSSNHYTDRNRPDR
jgi:nitrogen fixation-related uncharacterized protein